MWQTDTQCNRKLYFMTKIRNFIQFPFFWCYFQIHTWVISNLILQKKGSMQVRNRSLHVYLMGTVIPFWSRTAYSELRIFFSKTFPEIYVIISQILRTIGCMVFVSLVYRQTHNTH